MAIEVVAALIFEGDRLLACQRRSGGVFPLKWEFPGGKVEEGEESLDALRRELREELGIEIQTAAEIFRNTHRYPGLMEVELVFFRVVDFRGPLDNRAFQSLRWVSPEELHGLDFLDGDLPLIQKLTHGEIRV